MLRNIVSVSWTLLLAALAASAACGKVDTGDDDPVRACPAGTTSVCTDDQQITCDEQGNMVAMTACPLGCNASAPRCNKVDPSNGLADLLDEAALAPELTLVGATTIDTDAGTITDSTGPRTPPTSTLQTGLPVPVFVIQARSVATEAVTVVGARALAIVSAGPITIRGNFSVSARLDVNGPGALPSDGACIGRSGAGTNANGHPGGGGGGFGTAGGTGGSGGVPVIAGGVAGGTSGNVELVPLRGGCPGGHAGGQGPSPDPAQNDPGGGGGAVQLVSGEAIAIEDGAFVSANGAGGKGNNTAIFCLVDTPCGDGEGGGSGGAILLEAPVVTVAATGGLTANGGGGSCSLFGAAQAGQPSATPANGQMCGGDTGDGGNGAAGGTPARAGGNGIADDPVGAGGGGGHGRIRVNMPLGRTFEPAGVVSPASTIGALGRR